jgi:hypothetical protein
MLGYGDENSILGGFTQCLVQLNAFYPIIPSILTTIYEVGIIPIVQMR